MESHLDYHHSPENFNRSLIVGIFLNLAFVITEAIFGFYADSLALISDAGHNLSDVASLCLAWGASVLATKKANRYRTYGYRRVTLFASLISAVLLLLALGGIAWEAVSRFNQPQVVDSVVVIVVTGIGFIINAITAFLFVSGQKKDLNIRGAYLHMVADAGVSLGVVVAGVAMLLTGWLWLDPAISLFIVAVVLFSTWKLLTDSINLSIDAVPKGIDFDRLQNHLAGIKQVKQVHDLHVWAISTTETAPTVHLAVNMQDIEDGFLRRLSQELNEKFNITHSTVQLEPVGELCELDREDCVSLNDRTVLLNHKLE